MRRSFCARSQSDRITVTITGGTKNDKEVFCGNCSNDSDVVFCCHAHAAQNADIVFFIDSSGSMGDDIDGVRTNLAAFSRSLVSSDVSARFAVVEYQYSRGIIVHRLNNTDIWTSSPS